MRLLFSLLSYLPLWLLHGMGACLGWLVFGVSKTYRHRFLSNARQAHIGWRQIGSAVAHAGRMVAELPRIWLGAPVRMVCQGTEFVKNAYAQGRGVLLLTPHLGGFEMAAQAVVTHFTDEHGPFTVLYRPARQKWLAELVADERQRPGLHPVPTNMAGVRQMIKALRQGRAVGLLPDQVPPQGMGVWAPFFGKSAYSMTLAARLAQQTGCAICLVWCERLSWGRGFRVRFVPFTGDIPSDLEKAVACINQAMESLILECPQQYLWSYARYKLPREGMDI
jgi:Kdo2-lipid IVA lauroyltransferase/acyltransferase